MTKISTQDYIKKYLGKTQDVLVVNNNNVELLKCIELKHKKLALSTEKIKAISLILSILLQFVEIASLPISKIYIDEKVETSPVELCDGKTNKK